MPNIKTNVTPLDNYRTLQTDGYTDREMEIAKLEIKFPETVIF